MDVVSLQGLPTEFKVALLGELGYSLDSDRIHVVHKESRERVQDPYAKLDIRVDHMMVLPGSAILLDDNEFSLLSYLEDKGDIL